MKKKLLLFFKKDIFENFAMHVFVDYKGSQEFELFVFHLGLLLAQCLLQEQIEIVS